MGIILRYIKHARWVKTHHLALQRILTEVSDWQQMFESEYKAMNKFCVDAKEHYPDVSTDEAESYLSRLSDLLSKLSSFHQRIINVDKQLATGGPSFAVAVEQCKYEGETVDALSRELYEEMMSEHVIISLLEEIVKYISNEKGWSDEKTRQVRAVLLRDYIGKQEDK